MSSPCCGAWKDSRNFTNKSEVIALLSGNGWTDVSPPSKRIGRECASWIVRAFQTDAQPALGHTRQRHSPVLRNSAPKCAQPKVQGPRLVMPKTTRRSPQSDSGVMMVWLSLLRLTKWVLGLIPRLPPIETKASEKSASHSISELRNTIEQFEGQTLNGTFFSIAPVLSLQSHALA